jgi:hypothetical protein
MPEGILTDDELISRIVERRVLTSDLSATMDDKEIEIIIKKKDIGN